MKDIRYPSPNDYGVLCQRPTSKDTEIIKRTSAILAEVRKNGDVALRKFSQKFDQVELGDLLVAKEEFDASEKFVPPDLKGAIAAARRNIEQFHAAQRQDPREIETTPGVRCWRESLPITRVGLYVPGGSAPLLSTVLMLAVPAQLAGCPEVIVCTPPTSNGSVNSALLFTLQQFGLEKVFKVGGAQAIAAMAFGTESIPKVDKIFGPGNSYVDTAKQLVAQDGTAIDLPAGPSEVLVIADNSAQAAFVAADLLSQAEHGPDSQVVLVSPSEELIADVERELSDQLSKLPRRTIASAALEHSLTILTKDLDEAMAFSNAYAPEHLILAVAEPRRLAKSIQSAGSVFLGNYTPEALGDYASGTNHTLPTAGWARSFSGVSLDSFVKKITFQEVSQAGLEAVGPVAERLALAEGLQAHQQAVAIRLRDVKNV